MAELLDRTEKQRIDFGLTMQVRFYVYYGFYLWSELLLRDIYL